MSHYSSENHLAQFISPVKHLPTRPLLSPVRQQTVKYRQDEDRHLGSSSRLAGTDRLIALIQLDHSYSKPWRPEASNTIPTKTLFSARGVRSSNYNLPGEFFRLFFPIYLCHFLLIHFIFFF